MKGIQSEVVVEDSCLPVKAVTTINKLIAIDKVQALVANFCVIAVPPMAPAIERAKLLSFHTASVSDSILDAGEYIFGTNVKVRDEAVRVAEYAARELGAKTASVLFISTDFGEDYNKHFSRRFEELGGKVLSHDGAAIGVNEFRAELARVRGQAPDVLFVAHLGPTLGTLLKQAREAGIKSVMLGVYEAEDPTVIEGAGQAAEDLRFFTPNPEAESERSDRFRRKFKEKYGEEPRILASNAYDATVLALTALSQCRNESECARDAVYNTKRYEGVSGQLSFDRDGGVQRDLILKRVRAGSFVRVR